ncbi:MAG: PorP/SprF family type IX secretion system membrane protein [Bacteroidales bacterium]|nr:PorP/SprF family type IX secretion system membrane protein [Bacteroidales bacterium]
MMNTRNTIKYLVLILLLTGMRNSTYVLMAQDPQLSQFYSAPLYLGPSFAGSVGAPRISMNIRSQWVQLPHSFMTSSLFADTYIEKYKLGVGLSIMYDDAGGLINSTYASTQYSFRISFNDRWHFVPGIQAQYFTRRINSGALTFSDQIVNGEILSSTIEMYDDDRFHHFDFALSGMVFSDKYWIGITGNHLMKFNRNLPDQEDYSPLLFSAYGGITFDLLNKSHITKTRKNISLTFHYKTQERLHQLDLGLYHINAPFMLGIWYRGIPAISNTESKDAITLLTGYNTGPLSISYSYDITLSRLINTTGGSHEISVNYKFKTLQNRRRKIRAIPCPHF